jgi:small subunit ribosomal protein S9
MAENEDQVNEPEETPSQETPTADAPETPASEAPVEPTAEEIVVEGDEVDTDEDLEYIEEDETPRVKPAIPGMDLEVDIVREGEDAMGRTRYSEDDPYDDDEESDGEEQDDVLPETIADASIDLAAGARYRATGKRKTAVARVTLKPGTGEYIINGKSLNEFFPRATLQRTIRQPLETVGYEDRMDVIASMHGGGVSAQAGALRHGVSRALLEADPNLRTELKRRGFLTRDARVKERKKAGLKKARKRPQFSKR